MNNFFSPPKVTIKHIIIVLCLLAFVRWLLLPSDSNGGTSSTQYAAYQAGPYSTYLQKQQQAVLALDSTGIALRKAALKKLEANPFYRDMVLNKETSAFYLPALQILSEAIKGATTRGVFTIPDDLAQRTDSIGVAFAITAMTLTYSGGFTKELVDAFERYRVKYGYYGTTGRVIEPNGERGEGIVAPYDLTPIFYLLEPNNKKLANSIYEANSKVTFGWEKEEDKLYPELSIKKAYYKYLQRVDPKSKYIQWYDYEVSARRLYADYNENEVAADQVYKGKGIAVTGAVIAIKKGALGESYVVLAGTPFIGGVHCMMRSEEEAASMSKGYQYTIVGKCEGMVIGSVIMNDCEVE